MEKSINSIILVCCHKQDVHATEYPYYPIQVGKALSNVDLQVHSDDEGENISVKNGSFCELTGMYWAWKNLKNVDVIGLCHYRRYFDFHNQGRRVLPYSTFPTESFNLVDLSVPDEIIGRVHAGYVVVAKPMNYRYNLMVEYCTSHISDDFRVLRQVIKETQPPQVQEAFFQVFYQNNKLMHYNMFIMNWHEFDEYCSWLFPILEKVEHRVDISHYSSAQKRIFGYMAERLLNVWLLYRNSKTIKKPVLWFKDGDATLLHYSPLKYHIRATINNLGMLILRHSDHNF